MSNERTVDWEGIKRCLAALQQESKVFLSQALLIGGGACWFYRIQLRQAADPDFRAPLLDPQAEGVWLSKDIDFTGIFSGDAFGMLPHRIVTDAQGRQHIEIEGVRLGFAQVGLTIDPEEAFQQALVGSFSHENQKVEFFVADPVTLYREKQALSQKRNQKNDHLHLALLSEYLAWRVTAWAEQFLVARGDLPLSEQQRMERLLLSVRNKAPEILPDARIGRRVKPLLKENDVTSRIIAEKLQLS